MATQLRFFANIAYHSVRCTLRPDSPESVLVHNGRGAEDEVELLQDYDDEGADRGLCGVDVIRSSSDACAVCSPVQFHESVPVCFRVIFGS